MSNAPPADMIETIHQLSRDTTDAELAAEIVSIGQVLNALESMADLSPDDADNIQFTRQMLGAHQHELDRRCTP